MRYVGTFAAVSAAFFLQGCDTTETRTVVPSLAVLEFYDHKLIEENEGFCTVNDLKGTQFDTVPMEKDFLTANAAGFVDRHFSWKDGTCEQSHLEKEGWRSDFKFPLDQLPPSADSKFKAYLGFSQLPATKAKADFPNMYESVNLEPGSSVPSTRYKIVLLGKGGPTCATTKAAPTGRGVAPSFYRLENWVGGSTEASCSMRLFTQSTEVGAPIVHSDGSFTFDITEVLKKARADKLTAVWIGIEGPRSPKYGGGWPLKTNVANLSFITTPTVSIVASKCAFFPQPQGKC